MPFARYSACAIAWHRWEQPAVAVCRVVSVGATVPVFPAGTYGHWKYKVWELRKWLTTPIAAVSLYLCHVLLARVHVCTSLFFAPFFNNKSAVLSVFLQPPAANTTAKKLKMPPRLCTPEMPEYKTTCMQSKRCRIRETHILCRRPTKKTRCWS